jgi:hypothetical protein
MSARSVIGCTGRRRRGSANAGTRCGWSAARVAEALERDAHTIGEWPAGPPCATARGLIPPAIFSNDALRSHTYGRGS